jgi:hypothetical protein
MNFSDLALRLAWGWAGGECECKAEDHDHAGRCGAILKWAYQGQETEGGWLAHPRVDPAQGHGASAANCRILCWQCARAVEEAARRRGQEEAA